MAEWKVIRDCHARFVELVASSLGSSMIFPAQLVELDYLPGAFPVSGRKFPFNSLMGSKYYTALKKC